jgi:predicted peroxiredoxin
MSSYGRAICCLLGVLAMTAVITTELVSGQASAAKSRILIHVTQGPEHPTRAALAFLVARSALDEGHAVTLFLAGDAVQLIRDPVLDTLGGLGTGKLREHYDAVVKGGGRFYLSGMSSSARGVTATDLAGKPAEFAQPAVLVRLSLEHDRMFIY